jgi:hypothetical protein
MKIEQQYAHVHNATYNLSRFPRVLCSGMLWYARGAVRRIEDRKR